MEDIEFIKIARLCGKVRGVIECRVRGRAWIHFNIGEIQRVLKVWNRAHKCGEYLRMVSDGDFCVSKKNI